MNDDVRIIEILIEQRKKVERQRDLLWRMIEKAERMVEQGEQTDHAVLTRLMYELRDMVYEVNEQKRSY